MSCIRPLPVEACIDFLTAEDGGRSTSLLGPGSYRPNHKFVGDPDFMLGSIELADGEIIEPGQAVTKRVDLLIAPGLRAEISAGCQWHIQEGPRLVAIGTVLRVLGN